MSHSLLTRVAIAMRQAYADHTGDGIVPWSKSAPDVRKAWLACAAAAVGVMA